MFETLKRMYTEGKMDIVKLKNAVIKKYITVEQFKEISGEEYTL